ncbi:hypothetical protein CC86DRAFT_466925 [Ophiobolus disseminans]|uniref:MYND-type domain-containing protein n=1 Tax=Ophiobolus disseminans TaxID=1469910 RepID=A0A6A6ZYR7_9PLEO|nr:hypothetical protein CC86DRAFT_466925 [Ophiobolus disseminans]
MATREITIHFVPVGNKEVPEWSHTHSVPANLIATAHEASSPYQAECNAKAGKNCINCRGSAGIAALTPCSYLHIMNEPFINVLVHSTCGLTMCIKAAKVMMQEVMEEVGEMERDQDVKCESCGERENIKRCAKCKVVGYCGTACQKRGWKKHKKICAQLASAVPFFTHTTHTITTLPVHIQFIVDETNQWEHTHAIPTQLFQNPPAPDSNPLFRANAYETIARYQPECNTRHDPHCSICNAPSTTAILDVAWCLQAASTPHVLVAVVATCDKEECSKGAVAGMEQVWNDVTPGVLNAAKCGCAACGDLVKELKRCDRCKNVQYCGKKCQKQDWAAHKGDCVKVGEGEGDS